MGQKILIIDDDAQDRKAMTVVLEKAGYPDLLVAENAGQGLELARSQKPDVIVIDVVLDKHVDGFDLCLQLRREGEKAKIIMVTGHLDAINAQKARASGADEIIEKTAGFNSLGKTIKAVTGAA